jgi:hypothetical protein
MKRSIINKTVAMTFVAILFTFVAFAQQPASPPATATGEINGASITINYSSPGVKGRVIWGELVPYDKLWRAGANAATTIETSKDLKVEGKSLPAGKYSIFAIPGRDEWTMIFNTVPDQSGTGKYDESKDALRVQVKPKKSSEMRERLAYLVEKNAVTLSWENLNVSMKVK